MFKAGDKVKVIKLDSSDRLAAPYLKEGDTVTVLTTNGVILRVNFNGTELWLGAEQVEPTHANSYFAATPYTGTLPSGNYNDSWGYYMPYTTPSPVKSKCECGQSFTVRVNEVDDPFQHSRYCPVFEEKK